MIEKETNQEKHGLLLNDSDDLKTNRRQPVRFATRPEFEMKFINRFSLSHSLSCSFSIANGISQTKQKCQFTSNEVVFLSNDRLKNAMSILHRYIYPVNHSFIESFRIGCIQIDKLQEFELYGYILNFIKINTSTILYYTELFIKHFH